MSSYLEWTKKQKKQPTNRSVYRATAQLSNCIKANNGKPKENRSPNLSDLQSYQTRRETLVVGCIVVGLAESVSSIPLCLDFIAGLALSHEGTHCLYWTGLDSAESQHSEDHLASMGCKRAEFSLTGGLWTDTPLSITLHCSTL